MQDYTTSSINPIPSAEKSNFRSKLNALGPGILLASAAIGGSHLVASTQAGAIYGWQLAVIIILANLFKYPFFRFGVQYTLTSGKSLIEGYQEKGRFYLWLFLGLNFFAAIVNVAAVALLSATILNYMLPTTLQSQGVITAGVIIASLLILLLGKYRVLDSFSKIIMVALTLTSVATVAIAFYRNGFQGVAPLDYIAPSPWNMTSLAFIVALMGWMPAPIEFSAINSMWLVAKRRISKVSYQDGILDFNVGYISTAILALVFLALGALVQFGSGESVEMVGGKYIAQLINMYASVIGGWSKLLISFVAFMCIFGTTITALDGYTRANIEALRLILNKKESRVNILNLAIILTAFSSLLIIFFFQNAVGPMLLFAMIASFISTPLFALLNFMLVKGVQQTSHSLSKGLLLLSIVGLVYLSLFTLLFIVQHFGFIGA